MRVPGDKILFPCAICCQRPILCSLCPLWQQAKTPPFQVKNGVFLRAFAAFVVQRQKRAGLEAKGLDQNFFENLLQERIPLLYCPLCFPGREPGRSKPFIDNCSLYGWTTHSHSPEGL